MVNTRSRHEDQHARAVAHVPLIRRGSTRKIQSLAVQKGSVIITTEHRLSKRRDDGSWRVMDHARPNTTFGTLTVTESLFPPLSSTVLVFACVRLPPPLLHGDRSLFPPPPPSTVTESLFFFLPSR